MESIPTTSSVPRDYDSRPQLQRFTGQITQYTVEYDPMRQKNFRACSNLRAMMVSYLLVPARVYHPRMITDVDQSMIVATARNTLHFHVRSFGAAASGLAELKFGQKPETGRVMKIAL